MTSVKFYVHSGNLSGYEVSGHSSVSASDNEGKIVCAAVSSAAIMAANTITEIIGAKIVEDVKDGYMCIKLCSKQDECQNVLKGLRLHMNELAMQYPNQLKVFSEV